MTEHLKRCPFCKGPAGLTEHPPRMLWCVECESYGECNAQGPIRETEAEAIAAWNTRAEGKRIAELEAHNRSLMATIETITDKSEREQRIAELEAENARLRCALEAIAENDDSPFDSDGNPMPVRPQWSRYQCSGIARAALGDSQ